MDRSVDETVRENDWCIVCAVGDDLWLEMTVGVTMISDARLAAMLVATIVLFMLLVTVFVPVTVVVAVMVVSLVVVVGWLDCDC